MINANGQIRSLSEPTSKWGRDIKFFFDTKMSLIAFASVVPNIFLIMSFSFEGTIYCVLAPLLASIFFAALYKVARYSGKVMAIICFLENPWKPNDPDNGDLSLLACLFISFSTLFFAVVFLLVPVAEYYLK
jgi:hypothetical protein